MKRLQVGYVKNRWLFGPVRMTPIDIRVTASKEAEGLLTTVLELFGFSWDDDKEEFRLGEFFIKIKAF